MLIKVSVERESWLKVSMYIERIAVNMDRKKCRTFSSFRWLSPDIYHINILRNPNEVDVHRGRSDKRKYMYF